MPDSPEPTDPKAWRPDHPIPPWLEDQCRRGIADRLAAIEQLQRDLLVEIYPGRLAAIGATIDKNRNAIAAHKNTLGAYGIDPDDTPPAAETTWRTKERDIDIYKRVRDYPKETTVVIGKRFRTSDSAVSKACDRVRDRLRLPDVGRR